jgi:hypothetical protein
MPRTAIGAFYAMMRASYWKRASRNSASPRPAETDDARHFPRMPMRWSLGPKVAQSVSLRGARPCPELGVKPTCRLNARTSQFDPKRTPLCPVQVQNSRYLKHRF